MSEIVEEILKDVEIVSDFPKDLGNRKIIGTHDGSFHCDEVLSCSLLRLIPAFKNALILRSRNDDELDKCDIVVDVGGIFDKTSQRFDHHQRNFEHSFSTLDLSKSWKTKLSSAGLIYVYYGKEVLEIIAKESTLPHLEKLYDYMYDNFVEEIDAIDNGISIAEGTLRYRITSSLPSRVGRLNVSWRTEESKELVNERFVKAMKLVSEEFVEMVHLFEEEILPAHDLVAKAVEERHNHYSTGEIIVLESGFMPWGRALFRIEREKKISPSIKFILYKSHSDNMWRVRAVSVSSGSLSQRNPLRQEWQGLRDEELRLVSKIKSARFVHHNGFMGGATNFEDALQMAIQSLNDNK